MQQSEVVPRDSSRVGRSWRRLLVRIALLGVILSTGGSGRAQTTDSIATAGSASNQPASAQSNRAPLRLILGTVTEQRKYSIRVASGEEDLEVAIPDGVAIDQRLDRPRLDLANRLLTQELPGSQATGAEFGQAIEFQLPLPQPLGLLAEFSHPNERRRLLGDNPKRLIRYRLLPLENLPADSGNELTLTAEVKAVDANGLMTLAVGNEEWTAELGNRDARLGARSIADLKPFEAEVEVLADWIDNRWVAQEILFRRIARSESVGEQPRLLLLGDEVSLSVLHSLRKQLAGRYSVYHPPENCRGTAQWNRLPLWLGPYRQEGYRWDTIVFNVGLGDLSTEEVEYAKRLKLAVNLLRQTDAKLIWLTTTPLPSAWEPPAGPAAGKMTREQAQQKIARLNEIALEVLADFPAIKQYDLGAQVSAEREGKLLAWSRQSSAVFGPEQSGLVAEWIISQLAAPQPEAPK